MQFEARASASSGGGSGASYPGSNPSTPGSSPNTPRSAGSSGAVQHFHDSKHFRNGATNAVVGAAVIQKPLKSDTDKNFKWKSSGPNYTKSARGRAADFERINDQAVNEAAGPKKTWSKTGNGYRKVTTIDGPRAEKKTFDDLP
jgi:hypothetical protein